MLDDYSKYFLKWLEEHKDMITEEEYKRGVAIFSSDKPFFVKYMEYVGEKNNKTYL